jgi:hypothetical protein
MTDVKSLIATLTAERNAIDTAIAGLRQMTDVRNGTRETTSPTGARQSRVVAKRPLRYSSAMKRDLAARMRHADDSRENLSQVARDLALQFGLQASTINTNWRKWEASFGASRTNGNGATRVVVNEPEFAGVPA